jgi:hypothetical protein
MFDRICISPLAPEGTRFDLGLLAESLIFYSKVSLILGRNSLRGFLEQIGPDLLLELITEDYIDVRYVDHILGAITAGKGTSVELYDVGLMSLQGSDLQSESRKAFVEVTGKNGRGRRLASRFCKSVNLIQHQQKVTEEITRDMREGTYIEAFIRRRLARVWGNAIPNSFSTFHYRFTLIPGRGLQLQTNLDLKAVRNLPPALAKLADPASVLAAYGTTIADMTLWAQLNSEVAATEEQEDVLSSRVDSLVHNRTASVEKLSLFQDFIFDDARAVREALNTGKRQFKEILPILSQARKFHDWLSSQAPESNLLKAYHKEVTTRTWIDKLPAKTARWAIFTGAGIGLDSIGAGGLGIAAGVAASALDAFFLEKLIKGWRPNQFVEESLKDFLNPKKT